LIGHPTVVPKWGKEEIRLAGKEGKTGAWYAKERGKIPPAQKRATTDRS